MDHIWFSLAGFSQLWQHPDPEMMERWSLSDAVRSWETNRDLPCPVNRKLVSAFSIVSA